MSRIFLMVIVIMFAFNVSACGRQAEVQTPLPQNISIVTQPFLEALRRGDQRTAEKYVAPEFIDNSDGQFAKMSAILNDAPPLPSTIYQRRPEGPLIIFAAKDGKSWVSSEIRLSRLNNSYVVQYWDVKRSDKPPALLAHAQDMRRFVNYGIIAVAICAAFALAALIWFVRNRTHLIAREPVTNARRIATIVRNSEM